MCMDVGGHMIRGTMGVHGCGWAYDQGYDGCAWMWVGI